MRNGSDTEQLAAPVPSWASFENLPRAHTCINPLVVQNEPTAGTLPRATASWQATQTPQAAERARAPSTSERNERIKDQRAHHAVDEAAHIRVVPTLHSQQHNEENEQRIGSKRTSCGGDSKRALG